MYRIIEVSPRGKKVVNFANTLFEAALKRDDHAKAAFDKYVLEEKSLTCSEYAATVCMPGIFLKSWMAVPLTKEEEKFYNFLSKKRDDLISKANQLMEEKLYSRIEVYKLLEKAETIGEITHEWLMEVQ